MKGFLKKGALGVCLLLLTVLSVTGVSITQYPSCWCDIDPHRAVLLDSNVFSGRSV